MKRKEFLAQIGLLTAASLLPLGCSLGTSPKYKLGLQLFSVNQNMKDDPRGTLKKVKAMGYEDFEIYGFDPEKITFYGLPASRFKTILDDLGLSASSGHYGFSDRLDGSMDDLFRFVDACIEGALILKTPYITWPWISSEQRNLDTYKRLATRLNPIGERINQSGLGFAYHNHGFDFEDHEGTSGYDIILHETDPDLVKLQMDMYWVMHSSNKTPKEWVDLHPGRFVMWHIKDMDKATRDYTELGNGSIDYTTIMPDPVKSGLEYYYIEQGGNFTVNPLESAATSAAYFKKELQRLL